MEMYNYFRNMVGKATSYAIQNGVSASSENCGNNECTAYWWLRASDETNVYVPYVKLDGWNLDYGLCNKTDIGVRPSIRLQIPPKK